MVKTDNTRTRRWRKALRGFLLPSSLWHGRFTAAFLGSWATLLCFDLLWCASTNYRPLGFTATYTSSATLALLMALPAFLRRGGASIQLALLLLADMLLDAGCSWVLTGHSERRHILGESSVLVGEKTAFALKQGLCVILCVGESLAEREAGRLEDVLQAQLADGLANVPAEAVSRLAVAYEPVWAIGTGKVASAEDIAAAHAFVRSRLNALPGTEAGQSVRILYGGSVKPENAAGILALDNVDGLLVGGASLQAETFLRIIRAGQTA